jgi:hypothetical protein
MIENKLDRRDLLKGAIVGSAAAAGEAASLRQPAGQARPVRFLNRPILRMSPDIDSGCVHRDHDFAA